MSFYAALFKKIHLQAKDFLRGKTFPSVHMISYFFYHSHVTVTFFNAKNLLPHIKKEALLPERGITEPPVLSSSCQLSFFLSFSTKRRRNAKN